MDEAVELYEQCESQKRHIANLKNSIKAVLNRMKIFGFDMDGQHILDDALKGWPVPEKHKKWIDMTKEQWDEEVRRKVIS